MERKGDERSVEREREGEGRRAPPGETQIRHREDGKRGREKETDELKEVSQA